MIIKVTVDFLIGAETPETAKHYMEMVILGKQPVPMSFKIHPETEVLQL